MNVGIIGLGKMGEAIARGLLKKKGYKIYFNEAREERINEVSQKYPQIKHLELEQLIDTSEIIILAVKPQDLSLLLQKIESVLKREKLFISICAGVSIAFIQKYLKKVKIIRTMPNIGALIGKSFTAISGGENISSEDIKKAQDIFSSLGKVAELPEELINAVTAVSGSGPAYFAYFIKSLQKAARELGLSRIADDVVLECYQTTLEILREFQFSPQELIEKVASKGGTTEACLNVWEEENLAAIIKKGVKAAYIRAQELGK